MMAVFFDTSTSADETMNAIEEIGSAAGKQCFVSGMSAMITDMKDMFEETGNDLRCNRCCPCGNCNDDLYG